MSSVDAMNRTFNIITVIIAFLAIVSLLIDIGGYKIPSNIDGYRKGFEVLVAVYFVIETFAKLIVARHKTRHLKANWISLFLVLLLAMQIIVLRFLEDSARFLNILNEMDVRSITVVYFAVFRVYVFLHILINAIMRSHKIATLPLRSAQTVMLSFLLLILLGSVFLMMPRATYPNNRISYLDALFTSTSATCVTGLIVRNTGMEFTRFGQVVILVLIQIGGLGLMTMTVFFALVLGRGMGIKERALMSDVLNTNVISRIAHLVVSILLLTFTFEALGTGLLYLAWGSRFSGGQLLYTSIFHAISAFCNAGFSLYSDSLMSFRGSVAVNLIVSTLIICGGLGFTVLTFILRAIGSRWIFRQKMRMTVQAKVVLLTTSLLILLGFCILLIVEWDAGFAGLDLKSKLLAAYFQSVTARTAGFNTVDISRLSNGSLLLLICLMFIGASPGGTGGGIKTSTFAIALAFVLMTLRGRTAVEMFHRTIPMAVVRKAFSVIIISLLLLMVNGFLLLTIEKHEPMEIMFELVSAFGTVGLSMGITPELSAFGKAIIIVTMFIGRIGPLTLALALGERERGGEFEYPTEEIMVG